MLCFKNQNLYCISCYSPGTRSEKLARNQVSFTVTNIKGLHVPNISMDPVDDFLTLCSCSTDQHSIEK